MKTNVINFDRQKFDVTLEPYDVTLEPYDITAIQELPPRRDGKRPMIGQHLSTEENIKLMSKYELSRVVAFTLESQQQPRDSE